MSDSRDDMVRCANCGVTAMEDDAVDWGVCDECGREYCEECRIDNINEVKDKTLCNVCVKAIDDDDDADAE